MRKKAVTVINTVGPIASVLAERRRALPGAAGTGDAASRSGHPSATSRP